MLTEKDYCDYETCIALKELGFIGQGRCYYDLDKEPNKLRHFGIQVLTTRSAKALNFVLAIHLYEAQKWLREEKEVEVAIIPEYNEFAPVKGVQYRVWVSHWKDNEFGYETIEIVDEETRIPFLYKTYTEALSEGVKCAVKILKEK
jgi:hypothetical protein